MRPIGTRLSGSDSNCVPLPVAPEIATNAGLIYATVINPKKAEILTVQTSIILPQNDLVLSENCRAIVQWGAGEGEGAFVAEPLIMDLQDARFCIPASWIRLYFSGSQLSQPPMARAYFGAFVIIGETELSPVYQSQIGSIDGLSFTDFAIPAHVTAFRITASPNSPALPVLRCSLRDSVSEIYQSDTWSTYFGPFSLQNSKNLTLRVANESATGVRYRLVWYKLVEPSI